MARGSLECLAGVEGPVPSQEELHGKAGLWEGAACAGCPYPESVFMEMPFWGRVVPT